MNGDQSTLGRCPECGSSIPSGWQLIEYEREDGADGVFAECPSCSEVVAPK
ncbi:phage terminase large subunit family protein [Halosolutus halophilus]|uniref:phage terminase large subunit family protein n=1 Tax=Halosolutus halophilus TaxID=1552990 RepID=UPI002234F5F0|nr:phage terminase large subunit family protein [Halosolutus halophilus]